MENFLSVNLREISYRGICKFVMRLCGVRKFIGSGSLDVVQGTEDPLCDCQMKGG
jgi:hypothetical protein